MRFIIFIILIILPFYSYALREPRPLPIDSRIRVITFNPDDVYKYVGFYGYQASIEFASDEVIDNITMGDTISWQIVPSKNRIFLKPTEEDATTNMTVLTNKRMYQFELHAREASSINDPEMVFMVRFIYPDDNKVTSSGIQQFSANGAPDLNSPEKYNFKYTISGSELIAPNRIFDDGEFTYFKFPELNTEIPAFFEVDEKGFESVVNYRMSGGYVVIEKVGKKFTLRNGPEIVCVFNESTDIFWAAKKKNESDTDAMPGPQIKNDTSKK